MFSAIKAEKSLLHSDVQPVNAKLGFNRFFLKRSFMPLFYVGTFHTANILNFDDGFIKQGV